MELEDTTIRLNRENAEKELDKMEQTRYDVLVQGVMNLTHDVGYNFCFGCYSYGKSDSFKSIKCDICQECICQECGPIFSYSIIKKSYDLCENCHHKLTSDNTIVLLLTERGNNILSLDRFINPKDVIEHMVDQINDQLEGGEYYQYTLDFINTLPADNGLYLIVEISHIEENTTEDIDDVIDEIKLYLSEMSDGFLIDSSFINNTNDNENNNKNITEEITLDLECIS